MDARVSLEQWQALIAVAEAGGYAAAAKRLHKSQSAVTYLIKQLEVRLGVSAFAREGRRAVLTPVGAMLVREGRLLLESAQRLERAAHALSAGWEAEIKVAAEVLFPPQILLQTLQQFAALGPTTRIEIFETVLGGTEEALLQGRVDLAITPQIPVGFIGEPLLPITLVPVAHPAHPLHQLGRPVTARDLRRHRHLLVRDSGAIRSTRNVTVEVDQVWTFSHFDSSIAAAVGGAGFAWYPRARIARELDEGTLRQLPLAQSGERHVTLYLVLADPDRAGPGARELARLLKAQCAAVVT